MWLQKMVELFFQQLSPQIYTTLSKKLLHFVTYNVVPNATKEVPSPNSLAPSLYSILFFVNAHSLGSWWRQPVWPIQRQR
jgi:hypothetical protein